MAIPRDSHFYLIPTRSLARAGTLFPYGGGDDAAAAATDTCFPKRYESGKIKPELRRVMIHLHHAKPLSSAPLPRTLATPGLALARNEQIGGMEGGRGKATG